MEDRIFVIGIGGTGMRCLESFVHLCAIGMFDRTTVELLALDTDRENGNFRRLTELVDTYQRCKSIHPDQRFPQQDTFFSAHINFYRFSPDYADHDTGNFDRLVELGDLAHADPQKADLARLLFTDNTRQFDLKHGYRAQTHLGSVLMYHGIMEAANNPKSELSRYVSAMVNAGKTRVFVMGSVFGGTGASSIPILPRAFATAARTLAEGSTLDDVYWGGILLTSYFTFKVPSKDFVARQKVVATADRFALNSQAAMMFYEEDQTVKEDYQKFYMLGTPTLDFQTEQATDSEVNTGGARQRNDSHYIELFAAFAAYNFFRTPEDALARIRREGEVQYYYRTAPADGRLDFEDFVGPKQREEFAQKIGLMVALSHLTNLKADFYAQAQSGALQRSDITGYEDIDQREVAAIKKYLEYFNFRLDDQGRAHAGWMRQLYRSAGGGDKFLLHPELYGASNERELNKVRYNDKLYRDDFGKKHSYSTGLFGSPFDSFKSEFLKATEDPNLPSKIERLTKRVYDALRSLYKFG